jgi:hypothetical protein
VAVKTRWDAAFMNLSHLLAHLGRHAGLRRCSGSSVTFESRMGLPLELGYAETRMVARVRCFRDAGNARVVLPPVLPLKGGGVRHCSCTLAWTRTEPFGLAERRRIEPVSDEYLRGLLDAYDASVHGVGSPTQVGSPGGH